MMDFTIFQSRVDMKLYFFASASLHTQLLLEIAAKHWVSGRIFI